VLDDDVAVDAPVGRDEAVDVDEPLDGREDAPWLELLPADAWDDDDVEVDF
jgi:hypothetical protein